MPADSGPLHTQDCEPVTRTLEALSLAENNAEPVQVRLLHTTLEGPLEYVNDARWMESRRGFVRGIEWILFHGHLD